MITYISTLLVYIVLLLFVLRFNETYRKYMIVFMIILIVFLSFWFKFYSPVQVVVVEIAVLAIFLFIAVFTKFKKNKTKIFLMTSLFIGPIYFVLLLLQAKKEIYIPLKVFKALYLLFAIYFLIWGIVLIIEYINKIKQKKNL